MIFALLADIHSNLEALNACRPWARWWSRETTTRRSSAARAISTTRPRRRSTSRATALSASQRSYLASLPLIVRDGPICFVHSTAIAPEKWQYIQSSHDARERIEAAGTTYVHMQVLYFKTLAGKTAAFHPISGSAVPVHGHHHWLAIAGSAGQPRDANPSAAYAPGPAEPERTWWRSIASTVTANAQCSVHVVRLPRRSPADERGDGSER